MRTICNCISINLQFYNSQNLVNYPRFQTNNQISQDSISFTGSNKRKNKVVPKGKSGNLQPEILVKSPKECFKKRLMDFEELVIEGKQVSTKNLSEKISRAKDLAFCYIDGKLASICALKTPDKTYREKLFKNADIPELAKNYEYELGYSVTGSKYRRNGLNSFLTEKILEKNPKLGIYATVREHNTAEQKLLKKLGFERVGNPFLSYSKKHKILLFIR